MIDRNELKFPIDYFLKVCSHGLFKIIFVFTFIFLGIFKIYT